MSQIQIKVQPAVFDERWLDRIGTSFRFDHAKGIAEWLKNSIDAYIREGVPDNEQYVFLRFLSRTQTSSLIFECIDFVGMTHEEIVGAFKPWGDPEAATRGRQIRTYGGHGNGGKFYMRQMFGSSRFVTYRKGQLNVFGFNEKKKYGFAHGYENLLASPRTALDFSRIPRSILPDSLKKRFEKGDIRFTVVRGENPKRMRGRNTIPRICQRLRVHPQARKIIARKLVFAIVDDQPPVRLGPERINSRPGFEQPFIHEIPRTLRIGTVDVPMTSPTHPSGRLTLFTSEEPFSRYGDRGSLNCVDILVGIGCVASYRMNELGVFRYQPDTEFIYGECYCPILEDPEEDSVSNDREKLVENDRTRALLDWIRMRVDDLAEKMSVRSNNEKKANDLRQTSVFNDYLNRWKNRFMSRFYTEIFSGPGLGQDDDRTGTQKSTTMKRSERKSGGAGSEDNKPRPSQFPRVLLSNKDPDPLNPEQIVSCDPRHPPVYQRPEDVKEGIYWINTQTRFAEKILELYGAESPRWREYLFHRYVDIITKQAVFEKAKNEPELTATTIDAVLDDIGRRVYTAAADELYSFLFKEQLSSGVTADNRTDE